MLAVQEGDVRVARDPANGHLVRENENQQGLPVPLVCRLTRTLVVSNPRKHARSCTVTLARTHARTYSLTHLLTHSRSPSFSTRRHSGWSTTQRGWTFTSKNPIVRVCEGVCVSVCVRESVCEKVCARRPVDLGFVRMCGMFICGRR